MAYFTDLQGRWMPPGNLHRRIVADFSAGIPSGFSLLSGGVFSAATHEAVGGFATKVSVADGEAIGTAARVEGPQVITSVSLDNGSGGIEHSLLAARIKARVVGCAGNFGSTVNANRNFNMGFTDSGFVGGIDMLATPDFSVSINGYESGTPTSHAVDMDIRGLNKRYDPSLTVIKTPDGWDAVLGENETISHIASFTAAQLDMSSISPFIQWTKTRTAGVCTNHILQIEIDYWWF